MARCSAAFTRSAIPCGLEDLLKPPIDVVQHAVQVGSLELSLPLRAQALHDLAQPGDVATPRASQAALHEPLKGSAHVVLGQDVVGELVEHVVRIECRQLLAAVPSQVTEGAHG